MSNYAIDYVLYALRENRTHIPSEEYGVSLDLMANYHPTKYSNDEMLAFNLQQVLFSESASLREGWKKAVRCPFRDEKDSRIVVADHADEGRYRMVDSVLEVKYLFESGWKKIYLRVDVPVRTGC